MNRQIDKIPSETMRALTSWHWPGNIRELENFIERSVILSKGSSLRAPLSELFGRRAGIRRAAPRSSKWRREHILQVLRESGGVVTAAATRLGLHRTTLNAMMRKLGIHAAISNPLPRLGRSVSLVSGSRLTAARQLTTGGHFFADPSPL